MTFHACILCTSVIFTFHHSRYSPSSHWSLSNSLPSTFMFVFLSLDSTYERKHVILVFLHLAYFTLT
jgi:hypothetical protein